MSGAGLRPAERVDAALGALRESADAVGREFGEARLLGTLECVSDLRRDVDALEAAAVARAREFGRSWEQIGVALGVTRQAVWQKYGRPAM